MYESKTNKKKSEHWRRYKGTTPEDLCAAIRELWLAKYPNYIRLLNEIPNRLIEQEATYVGPDPKKDWYAIDGGESDGRKLEPSEKQRFARNRQRHYGRTLLRELEKFLSKQPFEDHFSLDPLEDELYWSDPDAPLSEYIEADKKRDAIIKKFSIKTKGK